MSHATIVSVCNFPIGPEFKPGLFPNDYVIPAATDEGLGIVVVSDGWTDIPQLDRKTIRVPVPAAEIARSIVEDWKIAQLEIGAGAQPGLFYVDGALSEDEIVDELEAELNKARTEHSAWCRKLIKMADDLWAIRPITIQISASMVNAAKFLNVDRAWLRNTLVEEITVCPSCTTKLITGTVVCPNCRVILDKDKYAELEFAK